MDDVTLRKNIVDELEFEPRVSAAHIGVSVNDGIVTLTGHVPDYAQKSAVEETVRRVYGVRGIAEEVEVQLHGASPYSDDDIAKRALTVLDLNILIPNGKLQVQVERGWLTLSGEVDWDYQRTAAIDDLRKLRGITGISNNIRIRVRANVPEVKQKITDALKRNAIVEASHIRVTSENGDVKLEGKVNRWSDRSVIEQAAWSVPGVRSVQDHTYVSN